MALWNIQNYFVLNIFCLVFKHIIIVYNVIGFVLNNNENVLISISLCVKKKLIYAKFL